MSQLPLSKKLAYAAGGLSMNLPNLVISQWLYKYWVGDGYAPLLAFSFFFLAGRITDAITDPLVAWWSDQSKSPRGRRIPFILWGVIPYALVIAFLWTPPVQGQGWVNLVYVCAMIQLFFILYTIVVSPYLALLPELTADVKERVNISTLQALFVTVGTMLFGVAGILIHHFGYFGNGVIVAVLTVIFLLPTILFIKERPGQGPAPVESASVFKWIGMTFDNKPFRYLIAATSLYWFALNLMLMLVPQWVQTVLGLTEDKVSLVMGPFILVNVIGFIALNVLSKRFGKYPIMLATLLGSAIAMALLFLVGDLPFGDRMTQTIFVVALLGVPASGFLMLPFAILSDCVDYDEKLTGQRREGIYFGVQAIFQKSFIGGSILFFGLMDDAFGKSDVASAELGLKYVALAAGAAALLGFFSFLGYPIRERGTGLDLPPVK